MKILKKYKDKLMEWTIFTLIFFFHRHSCLAALCGLAVSEAR